MLRHFLGFILPPQHLVVISCLDISAGTTTDSASFVRRVWTLWKSNRLWRFGFEVRGKGARPCRAGVRSNFTMPLHKCVLQCRESLPKGVLRSSRVRMRTVHVFKMSDPTDLLPGYGRGLSHSPNITKHVHNQSANICLPTGPVERKLFLGPNVGFPTSVTSGLR